MNLLQRIGIYKDGVVTLTKWLGSGGEIVPKEQAQSRANVCAICPMNEVVDSLSGTVASAIKSQLKLKSHLQLRVDGEKSLNQCRSCGCSLPLKVWIPLKHLNVTELELDNYVPYCWLRTEYNSENKTE